MGISIILELAREFAEAGCSVFMESSDLPLLSGSGSGALAQEAVMPLKDGQVFELGGRALETILVPGHTPGSAIFWIGRIIWSFPETASALALFGFSFPTACPFPGFRKIWRRP